MSGRPIIEVRRNADGVVRSFEDEHGRWEEPGADFIWEEGNYSCDCNRCLFFVRAGPDPDSDETECECGDNGYSIRIKDASGKVLYQDGEWPA